MMIPINVEKARRQELVKKSVAKFALNLEGLTVFTEAASGNYLYIPIIAALAGAEHVYAVTTDSKQGKKEDVERDTISEARNLGVDNRITVLFEKDRDSLSKSDIITNSGFVRPITREMVSWLKPTAVIPLMYETWELREQDVDLSACQEREILVLGTNEHHPLLNLFAVNGFLICKLLFDAGLDVYKDNLLLIASGPTGDSIASFFMKNNVSFRRVTFNDNVPDNQKASAISQEEALYNIAEYDDIIVFELQHNVDILSRTGFIPVELLQEKNCHVQIIHISGSVNKDDILKAGLALYPEDIRPFGYQTVSADYLGPKTVLELNTAGLKVGEVMARCRLKGISIEDTVRYALENSPADDFKERFPNE